MRSPADALKDPRPGDVVKVGKGWSRRVTMRGDFGVEFYSSFGNRGQTISGPHRQSIQDWQLNTSHGSEVLHVAND